jgi:hypothetical protein
MNTPVVIFLGTSCVLFWVIAYFAIIWRGFKDRTFGMPIAALAANISWEAMYSFAIDPLGDYLHILSIPCFFIDLVIAWQCLTWGAKDFAHPFVKRNFKMLFAGAIAIAYPVLYYAFYEFKDPLGEYTGFGINLMMSILFVAMLLRRDTVAGQSMYIAISKWLGTLMAYVATAVQATATMDAPWPDSLASLAKKTVQHDTYPLTPLINVVYLAIFVVDLLYIFLLYRKFRESKIDPWRRL